MENALSKTVQLLKFYFDNETKINLELKNGLQINGTITDKNSIFFRKWIVMRNFSDNPIKIFVEDIVPGSIIPEGYIDKDKNIQTIQKPIERENKRILKTIINRDKIKEGQGDFNWWEGKKCGNLS